MEAILLRAGALVLIIVAGYLLKKFGFFKPTDYKLITKIVFNITFPATIIFSFSDVTLDYALLTLIPFGLATNIVLIFIGWLIARKKDMQQKMFYMINLAGYNIACFTLPFTQSFLGPLGIVATCMFDIGNSIMSTGGTFALANGMAESGGKRSPAAAVKTLFSSVPFDVYLIMLVLCMCGVKVPDFGVTFTSVIGSANIFLAMLMIGMMFELNFQKEYVKETLLILGIRYGTSVAFAALVLILPFSVQIQQVLLILVFGPIPAMATIFTERYGGNVAFASMVNSLTIVISTVLITLMLPTVMQMT